MFMDNFLKHYSGDSIRKMMLMHEEVFKEQVAELHRLYKVQKMMMAQLYTKETKFHLFSNQIRHPISLGSTTFRTNSSNFGDMNLSNNEETSNYSSQESFETKKGLGLQDGSIISTKDNFNLHRDIRSEHPVEEETSTEASFIKCPMSLTQRILTLTDKTSLEEGQDHGSDSYGDAEVELTLSIGSCYVKKKAQDQSQSITLGLDEQSECCMPFIESFRGENMQQPPWPSQSLSFSRAR